MLDVLRKSAKQIAAYVLIGLLVLSFAVWGIADIFTGFRQDTVATVGEIELTSEDYREAYQDEVYRLSQRFGRRLTSEQARMLGAEQSTLQQLITRAAIDEHARNLGLGIDQESLIERVRETPAFQAPDGTFSRTNFRELLSRSGLSEAGYLQNERANLVRRQITSALLGELRPPETLSAAMNAYDNERRTIAHFTLDMEDVEAIPEPDETTLRSHYDDNEAEFTAPEYRKLDLLVVTPDSLKETIEVSEADLEQQYESRLSDYTIPEKRHVLQMSFPDSAAAAAAHAKLESGMDFMALAEERGLSKDDLELGTVTQSEMVDPKIGEAAFSLAEGAYSDPVDGALTTAIVRVTEIQPGSTRSLEEVKDEIRTAIQLRRAQDEVLNLYDNVEDMRAGGSTLAEIAGKLNLEHRVVEAVSRSGETPDGKQLELPVNVRPIVNLAYESDVGVENDPVEAGNGGFVWVDVIDVQEPALKPFDTVTDEVADSYKQAQKREALTKMASEAVEKIRGGTEMTVVAETYGAEVNTSEAIKRTGGGNTLPQAAVSQAFTLDKSGAGSAWGGDRTRRIVFQVREITEPEPLDDETRDGIEQRLAQQMASEMGEQYIAALRERFGVTVNEANFRRVTGADVR